MNILILTTANGILADSLKSNIRNINVNSVREIFLKNGFDVKISTFEALEKLQQYKGWYILYASSEDSGLFYKSYIEDIALALEQAGAILLPRYELLRAHHNKSYMELRRSLLPDNRFKTIQSKPWPSWALLIQSGELETLSYPAIMKTSAGAGSSGVRLVNNVNEAKKAAKRLSKVLYTQHNWASFVSCECMVTLRKLRRKIKHNPVAVNYPGEKFIVQNFIPRMGGDYKVLVFGKKYYVLNRKNRDNDFRASGSGAFSFPQEVDGVAKILDFAYDFYQLINSPLCSLDIGKTDDGCHLIEFQCLNFGPYTLEFSDCWFEKNEEGKWQKHVGASILEEEYTRAIIEYISRFYI